MLLGINMIHKKIGLSLIAILFIFETLNWLKILNFNIFFTWRGLLITTIIAVIILESINFYVRKKTKQQLKGWVYLCAAFLLYFDAIGDTLGLYQISWYDQVAHLSAGFWAMLMLYTVFLQIKLQVSLRGKLLFAWCITATIGTVYEIEEYIEDLVYKTNRLGDGFDTANDLLMNNSGALLMLLVITLFWHFHYKKNK